MKATLEIDAAQIAEAIRRHIEQQGWKVEGKVELVIRRGWDGDPREPGTPDTVIAKVNVSPKPPSMPSAYGDRDR